MTPDRECTRCGTSVPAILGPPPDDRDRWHRYLIRMRRREVVYTLRFRIFTLRWLPANPSDQLRETYTELDLCDPCARVVLRFAQTAPVAEDA